MTPTSHRSVATAILFIVLFAGTLDITDALVFYGLRFHVAPHLLLQNIASHLIGRSAFTGGLRTTLLGLAIHYFIAAFWVTCFVLAAQRIPLLVRRAALCGTLYGLLLYAAMNYVVLPHTIVLAPARFSPAVLLNGILALVLFMGLTVALLNVKLAPTPPQS